MIIVTGSATGTAATIAEMTALALEHVHRSRTEKGCLRHGVHIDADNPLRLTFIEIWADDGAIRAHFAVPESRAFIKRLRALAVSTTPVEVYQAQALSL